MKSAKHSRPKIGVALSGGGARGFAHIGALKVLHEAGIPIDYLAGTSVGSVIGAAYASGITFEEMTEVCRTMRWRDIAKVALSKRGLASIARSQELLNRLIKVRTFEELRTRFYAVATDIRTGEMIVLSRGDLKRAVQASCAIPGLFVPVEVQGRWLVDGGVTADLPVIPLRQLGADKILAIDASSRANQRNAPENIYQILLQSMFIIGRAAGRVAREQAHLIVEPEVGEFEWDGFEQCEEIVRSGERAMRASLPFVQAWLQPREKGWLGRLRAAFHRSAGA
jgi:NTE family protein